MTMLLIKTMVFFSSWAVFCSAFLPDHRSYSCRQTAPFAWFQQTHPTRTYNYLYHTGLSMAKIQSSPPNRNKNTETNVTAVRVQKNYNDDAFGLVFLTGACYVQDYDFAGTFLAASAAAAILTYSGTLSGDERLPGGVAMVTLILAPIVSSLRASGGSLDVHAHAFQFLLPPPIEIGLCAVSVAAAFFNWTRRQ